MFNIQTINCMLYSEPVVIQTWSQSHNEIYTPTEHLVQKHNDLLSLKRSNLVPNEEKRKQGNKKEKQNHYTWSWPWKWQEGWIMWFQKISIPPPHGRDRNFPGGRGVNLPNFPVRRGGVTIGKYFQRVLVTHKRVTKKKHKNLPRQYICEDIMTDCKRRYNDWGYPFKKKLSSVRTTWAIRLKKVVIRSNCLGYPFEKIVIRSNGSGYPFEKEFVDRSSGWSYLFKDKF